MCRYIYWIWRWWHHRKRVILWVGELGRWKRKTTQHPGGHTELPVTSQWHCIMCESLPGLKWRLLKVGFCTNGKEILKIGKNFGQRFNWILQLLQWMLQSLLTWSIQLKQQKNILPCFSKVVRQNDRKPGYKAKLGWTLATLSSRTPTYNWTFPTIIFLSLCQARGLVGQHSSGQYTEWRYWRRGSPHQLTS